MEFLENGTVQNKTDNPVGVDKNEGMQIEVLEWIIMDSHIEY